MQYFMPNGPRGLADLWPEAPQTPRLVALNGHPCGARGLHLEARLGRVEVRSDGRFALHHAPFAPGTAGGHREIFEAVLVAGPHHRRVRFAVAGPGHQVQPGAQVIGRFGALTRAGEGGLDTTHLPCGPALDGAYGPFVVTGGVIRPGTSPLPLGAHGIGPYLVEVAANTQSVGTTQEFGAAIDKPSAYHAQKGGTSDLTLELREGAYDPPGAALHGRFRWHPGPPLTIRSADPAAPARFGRFWVGHPNGDPDGPPWGQVRFEDLTFFLPSRTRPQAFGTNWTNIYDQFGQWNLTPFAMVEITGRGAFVQDVAFLRCRFASDLPDLSQVPIPDLPLDEITGLFVRDGRRVVVVDCLFEHLYNGLSVSGEDCVVRGNTQRFCHGDMIRSGSIPITGGGELPTRRLLVEHNRWYSATGDNFRHPDGVHIFALGQAGIREAVIRGNIFLCDAKTLAQPPKPTGFYGTLQWQEPQAGTVRPPAQNAVTWLIDDQNAPATVHLPAFRRLPTCPGIAGGYGVGADRVRLARSDRNWRPGDSFVHAGTRHQLVEPVGDAWTITPPLTRATGGWGDLRETSGLADGARLAQDAQTGDREVRVRMGHGRLEPGDSFHFDRVFYRIDQVSGDRLRLTPEIKAPQPAGTPLGFAQHWSIQRLGPVGQGIRLVAAPGEEILLKTDGRGAPAPATEVQVPGAWGGFFVRHDLVGGRWQLNETANTAYQTIFSGTDPREGYSDVQIFANIGISPGKGLEFGHRSLPSARNGAVSNIFAYPWPGDLDGDGVANTGADGRQWAASVPKLQLGGPEAEAQDMRIAGNIAGTATYLSPQSGEERLLGNESFLALNAQDRPLEVLAERFQGAQGPRFLPEIGEVVDALRPQPGGPTEHQGLGMLGSDPAGDLWDFKTGRLVAETPWEVLRLTVVPRVDGAEAGWLEPAYRPRESLFGAERPVTAYRLEASGDGGNTWAGQDLPGGESGASRLQGLAPGARLRLRVRAQNAKGWGVWTPSREVVCPTVDPALSVADGGIAYPLPRPQAVRAVVVSVSFFGGAPNGIRALRVNGAVVAPVTARAEANRGLALFVLEEAALGEGTLEMVPVFASGAPEAWHVHATTVAGVAPGARPIASVLTGIGGTGGEVVTAGPETVLLAGASQTGHRLLPGDTVRVLSRELPGFASRLAHAPTPAGGSVRVRLEAGPVWTMLGVLRLKMAG